MKKPANDNKTQKELATDIAKKAYDAGSAAFWAQLAVNQPTLVESLDQEKVKALELSLLAVISTTTKVITDELRKEFMGDG